MKKALVTGCAGFIGSSLTDELLSRGYEVTGIDAFTDYYDRAIKRGNIAAARGFRNFELIEADINSMDAFPDVDYVFHLAAQAGVRSSWGKSFEIYTKCNVNATQKLLEFYKGKAIGKFVYASSSSVYGDSPLPMREENVVRPISPYGVTKLAGENLCYLYYRNYGLPAISLRYFTVYGPRQRPDMGINKFTRAIRDGQTITIYGDGEQNRDFTYVSDVVNANILAAQSPCKGEVFNVGGGSKITVNQLIGHLETLIGKKAVVERIEKQKGDVENTWAEISKAEKLLGWAPTVTIVEGLKKYVEFVNEGY